MLPLKRQITAILAIVASLSSGMPTPVYGQSTGSPKYVFRRDFKSLQDFINLVIAPIRINQRGASGWEIPLYLPDLALRTGNMVYEFCPGPDNNDEFIKEHKALCDYLSERVKVMKDAITRGEALSSPRNIVASFPIDPDKFQELVSDLVNNINVPPGAREALCKKVVGDPLPPAPTPTPKPTNTPVDPTKPTPTPTSTNTPKPTATPTNTPNGPVPTPTPTWTPIPYWMPSPSPSQVSIYPIPMHTWTQVALGGDGPQIVQGPPTVDEVREYVKANTEKADQLAVPVKNGLRFIYGTAAELIVDVMRLRHDASLKDNPLAGVIESLTVQVTGNSGYGGGGNPPIACKNQPVPECCQEIRDSVEVAVDGIGSLFDRFGNATIGDEGQLSIAGVDVGPMEENYLRSLTDSATGKVIGKVASVNRDSNVPWLPELVKKELVQFAPIQESREGYAYIPTWLLRPEVASVPSSGPLGDATVTPYGTSMFMTYGEHRMFAQFAGHILVMPDASKPNVCRISQSKLKPRTIGVLDNHFARYDLSPLFGAPFGDSKYNPFTNVAPAMIQMGMKHETVTCLDPSQLK